MALRVLAFFLSYIPGLGHALRGLWLRAALAAGLGLLVFLATPWSGPIVGVLGWVIRLGIAIDATRGEGRFPGWAYAIAALGVLCGAFATVQTVWMESYRIPSGTMIPTLQVGDSVVVWKRAGAPARGDLVVFAYPREPSKDFVKRVVAVGGDTIAVKDNQLVINGKPVPRVKQERSCAFDDFDDRQETWGTRACVAYRETLGDHHYLTIDAVDEVPKDFPGPGEASPYVIPAGQLFVMGDNRNNSHDSRFWGTVGVGQVKGKVTRVTSSRGKDGQRWERYWSAVD
jgi:signal peptidase I